MVWCAVANCSNDSRERTKNLSFFSFPTDKELRKKWIEFCGRERKLTLKTSFICMEHFKMEDIQNNMKYEMGFAVKRLLRPDAVPTIRKVDTKGIEKEQREEYKQIVGDLLREYEEETKNIVYALENNCTLGTSTSRDLCILNSNLPEVKMEEVGLINEALFDHEEIIKNAAVSPIPTSIHINPEALFDHTEITNHTALTPMPTEIQIKTEDAVSELENDVVTKFSNSKSSQTDEASEDRINCGFINISKSGPCKYLNLRCFYCDAEYPISYWSEFSDHIINNHSYLEKEYEKEIDTFHDYIEDCDKEVHTVHLTESVNEATQEQMPQINFIDLEDVNSTRIRSASIEEIRHEAELIEILSDNTDAFDTDGDYLYADNYEPTIEHSYSQSVFNINFHKAPRKIVIDFLEHLKGFPSLWHKREIDCVKYDNQLLKLLNIMKIKWNLNLGILQIGEDLENIKTCLNSLRKIKETNPNAQHIFQEYYEKCTEFIYFENSSEHNFHCDICNRDIFNAIDFQMHKYLKHNIGQLPYGCSKCNMRFGNVSILLKHVKTHNGLPSRRKRKTEQTPRRQRKKQKLVEESSSTTTLECFECNKKFDCTNEYKLHLDIHPHGERKYACEECGKRFKDDTQRKTHQKSAHKPAAYQCEFCPIKLGSLYTFKAHMYAHKGIYEYVCEWCGKKFVNRKYWREHCAYVHLGRGLCKICNREYKQRSILWKHLRNIHRPIFGTNEELAKRTLRGYALSRKKPKTKGIPKLKLRKYEYVLDPVTKTHRLKCPKCDKTFRHHKNVREHAMKIHDYDMRDVILKPQGRIKSNYRWKAIKVISDDNTIDKNAVEVAAVKNPVNRSAHRSDNYMGTDEDFRYYKNTIDI